MNDDSTPVKSAHGLYAKIGLDFPDDPKVIEAGAYAELAYLRCTLHAKANRSDGKIHRLRLSRWLAGIPGKPEKHMDRLVAVGLLEVHADGWAIPERVWRRWNKTAEEIDEVRVQKQEAAAKGNHVRHHVEKGITRGDCLYCERPPVAQSSHPAKPQREKVVAEVSPETETKTKTKPEVKTETYPHSSSSDAQVSSDPSTDDDEGSRNLEPIINRVVKIIASIKTEKRRPDDFDAYHASVVDDLNRNERPTIAAFLIAKPYLRVDAEKAAQAYLAYKPKRVAS